MQLERLAGPPGNDLLEPPKRYRRALLSNLSRDRFGAHGHLAESGKNFSMICRLNLSRLGSCGIRLRHPSSAEGEFSEGTGPGIDVYSLRQPLRVIAGITPFESDLSRAEVHHVGSLQRRADGAHQSDFESVEDPRYTETDQQHRMERAPGQTVQPRRYQSFECFSNLMNG